MFQKKPLDLHGLFDPHSLLFPAHIPAWCLQQAPVAKKKIAKPNKEVSEEVTAQTMVDKVTEAMSNCLKEVGTARTSAITLQGLEYADNLSETIKKHAEKVEKFYGEVQQKAKASSSTSDKEYGKMLKRIEELSQGTKKLQADQQLSI